MNNQWIRKCSLILTTVAGEALDLSELRIAFSVKCADVESPNNAEITVYNLSPDTVSSLVSSGEYTKVVLSAGYEEGNFGVIFYGSIRQYRTGRLDNNVDSFVTILASDGDVFYNQGTVNTTIAAGATPQERIDAISASAGSIGTSFGSLIVTPQNVPAIRGQVFFGLARARLRNAAADLQATWSIQNGVVTITPKAGYSAGEAVILSKDTGLIGVPEQTPDGIVANCLLNSRLVIGDLVELDNSSITTLTEASSSSAPVAYNTYTGLYNNAALSGLSNGTGTYKAFAYEHHGDTRGNDWYTRITMLAIDLSSLANG